MRKRERENPCDVCGHYHKYEEGEVCGVCGHRVPAAFERPIQPASAFPSEILTDFLYLGSYDNASRGEILKTLRITHILNTVPACQNLYKNSFTYHCLQDDKVLQFDDAIQFLVPCINKDMYYPDLLHSNATRSRHVFLSTVCWAKIGWSPAIVMAYLMKCKGWRFAQSFQWVRDRRSTVELSPAVHQQLLDYEQKIFGSGEAMAMRPVLPPESLPSFGFGLPVNTSPAPVFNQPTTASIFDRSVPSTGSEFVFGAGRNIESRVMENNAFVVVPPTGGEAPMDSS
ncbi:DSPc [Musa troglodytarum]|uniref:DSPc n=1 Tax=Musa troglodytarum TaxID=320322 RepID=A0A9E7GXV0_9LILI|nr:DSPc [Musa troglodytarum]